VEDKRVYFDKFTTTGDAVAIQPEWAGGGLRAGIG
jgi:hypothetical protein